MWDDRFETLVRKHIKLPADEPLNPDARLADLGLGSIQIVDLLVDLEQAFDIVFTDELLAPDTFGTPRSLWKSIANLLSTSR
jgi:acyl carrier protein